MAKISYCLKRRQGLPSEFRQITLRVFHLKNYCYITLDLPPVKSIDFDSYSTGAEIRMCSYYHERKRVNALLARYYTDTNNYIQTLQVDGDLRRLSCKQLRDRIARRIQPMNLDFIDYTINLVQKYEEAKRYGSARTMAAAINSFTKFVGTSLSFHDLTYKLLCDFDTYCRAKGLSKNTIAGHLSYIRLVYNRAIKDDVITGDNHPFKKYKIKYERTAKRAISKDEIRMIRDYIPNPLFQQKRIDAENYARDMFMFSFYVAGINFKDMAFLKKANLVNGILSYSRCKTADKFIYKLPQVALDIIEKYKRDSDYLLPIVLQTEATGMKLEKHITNRCCAVNKYLKRIGSIIGIEQKLSTYVARHSYATIALNSNVPIEVISQLLGHESITTTQIYLRTLHSSKLSNYNSDIVAL